jgi:hypothetical protein
MKVILVLLGSLAGGLLLIGLVARPGSRGDEPSRAITPGEVAGFERHAAVPAGAPATGERRRVVTRRAFLEEHFGDAWPEVEAAYAGAGLDRVLETGDLAPWEEAAGAIRQRARETFAADAAALRRAVAGWDGPIGVDELPRQFELPSGADVLLLSTELATQTVALDERILSLADEYAILLEQAIDALVAAPDPERYPLAPAGPLPRPRQAPDELYRLHAEAEGWTAVFRVRASEFPALGRVATECRRMQALRRQRIQELLDT